MQTSDLMVLGDPSQEILIRDLPSFLKLGAVPVTAEPSRQESSARDD